MEELVLRCRSNGMAVPPKNDPQSKLRRKRTKAAVNKAMTNYRASGRRSVGHVDQIALREANRVFGMTDIFEAFRIYKAIRLHFNSESYDYFKYHGKVNWSKQELLKRKDKYQFSWLGDMYDDLKLPYFIAVNLYANPTASVTDLLKKTSHQRYKEWKAEQSDRPSLIEISLEPFKDNFKEVITPPANGYPELFNLINSGRFPITMVVILDYFMKLTEAWNGKLAGDPVWDQWYKQYQKFRPFFFEHQVFENSIYKQIILSTIGTPNEQ
jgi:hypothetical protein